MLRSSTGVRTLGERMNSDGLLRRGIGPPGLLAPWHSTVKHSMMRCQRQQQPTRDRPAIALGNSLGNSPRSRIG